VNRLLITGAGAVTALGRDLSSTRQALAGGASALAAVPSDGLLPGQDPSLAARIITFSTEPELAKAKARRWDRGSQYTYVAVKQCLTSAGYEVKGREERTGILIGTGSSGAGPLTELERQMAMESPEAASPFLFPYTVSNAPGSQTAIDLGIKGPSVTLIQKDSVPLNALRYARMLLADGRSDAIVVGAVDEWNLVYHRAYERARLTGTAKRPGFSLGEGAAVVLLETEDSASARGAVPLCSLAGIGSAAAPVSPQKRRATPDVLARAMERALSDASSRAESISLVHLSANGVPWMDEAEIRALEMVFGKNLPATQTVKTQLGENPAIVAVQMALAADSLRNDPGLGSVLVNSFGAGGTFLCAVFEKL
jgi:3-oxoacyl-(acyl-carrier-protein) synthase